MSNEYIALPVEDNSLGLLAISRTAVETLAATAVKEVENVKLTEKKNPITCKIIDKALTVKVDVQVDYRANISEVCLAVQTKINQVINQTIELSCKEIDVRVVGFIF